jgi:CYTH domain-containing protein
MKSDTDKNISIPLEIERKFLIRYPDLNYLLSLNSCRRSEIVQTYLLGTDKNSVVRVRKSGSNGKYVYTLTAKKKITDITRIEDEKIIQENEYAEYLKKADPTLKTITKDRYSFYYKSQLFEIDVFPFWNDRAYMEIELGSEDQNIDFPEFIEIIREVTDDRRYANRALAEEIPMDPI